MLGGPACPEEPTGVQRQGGWEVAFLGGEGHVRDGARQRYCCCVEARDVILPCWLVTAVPGRLGST